MLPYDDDGNGSQASKDLSALTGLPSQLSQLEAHGIDPEVAYKKFLETKDAYGGGAELTCFIIDAYLKAQTARSCLSVSDNGHRGLLASPVRLDAASRVGDNRRPLTDHPHQQPGSGQGEPGNGDERDRSNEHGRPKPYHVPLPATPSPSPRLRGPRRRSFDLNMNAGVPGGRDGTGRPPIRGLLDEDKHKEEWEARDEEVRDLLGRLKRAMSDVVDIEIDARLAMWELSTKPL